MKEVLFALGLLIGGSYVAGDTSREQDSFKLQRAVDSGMAVTYRLTPELEQKIGIDTATIKR